MSTNAVPLNFNLNVQGVAPGGGFRDMGNTLFRATVEKVYGEQTKDGDGYNAVFHLKVTEPAAFAGTSRIVRTRVVDGTQKGQNSRGLWRAWFESLGYDPAVLDAQANIGVSESLLVGKIGHFYNKETVDPSSGKTQADVEVLTPSIYAERLRAVQTQGSPLNSASGAVAAAGGQQLGMGGNMQQPMQQPMQQMGGGQMGMGGNMQQPMQQMGMGGNMQQPMQQMGGGQMGGAAPQPAPGQMSPNDIIARLQGTQRS